jgi:endoglucanase
MKRLLTVGAALMIVLPFGSAASAAPSRAAASAIRVDQVGYAQSEAKRAYLLSAKPAPGATFTVRDSHGHAALTGKVGPNAGAWNDTYTAVHPIDFGRLRTAGTYTIKVGDAVSPPFRIAPADKLFNPLVRDAVSFFTVQRDGADVDRRLLDRKPSHLTDRKATVYDPPVFTGEGGDEIAAPLKAIGGPVDVEGGWFDAGDFVKFTHTTAYALAELLWVQRGGGPVRPDETYRGLTWLDKMWDAQHQTLYAQVGIGTGSEDFNFLGDHDVWRLPEADDALKTKPGDEDFFIKYRPVFTAAPPGQKISPNLAGRVSAAFALGAQVALKRGDTGTARRWFGQASSVYAQAETTDVGELVTAYPHAYYPEDSWADDMEFGAAELARTGRLLGDPRAAGWLKDSAKWAAVYLGSDSQETLNLYDTSALGHTELLGGIRATHASGLAVSEGQLVGDLQRQLDFGVDSAAEQPFGHAVDVTNFDAATRSFGFAATAQLYHSVTGKATYDAFGTRQRDFALGANAWGASLMIGEGTNYPLCPQHQVANLAGSLTGGNRVIKGAVVNGPNGADNFEDLGIPDGANACPADGGNRFAAYDTADARFLDDVRAWPSVEPALDFTATAALALSLTARTH